MPRINLLPPEILQKRKAEKWLRVVALVAVALLCVLAVVYAGVTWSVSVAQGELQGKKDQAAGLQKSAEAFKIFESKQAELVSRKATVDTALASRIDWARLLNELSLVLPEETWLERLQGNQDSAPNLQLQGWALDPADSPDNGHKVIAKTLVRLAGLDQLVNVWLTTSQKDTASAGGAEAAAITFQITSGIVKPAAPASATPSVPAPPTSQ